MIRPKLNHGSRDAPAAQTAREAIDVRSSDPPGAAPYLRTQLTSSGQGSHRRTYFFRVELVCLPRLIPNVLKEALVSVEQSEQFSSVQKTIRRALNLPPTTVMDLTYDSLMKGIKIIHAGHLKTFLDWTEKSSKDAVTLFVSCDELQPPAPLKLKSSSKRRRERQRVFEQDLKEERVSEEKATERLAMSCKPSTEIDESIQATTVHVKKKPRKDLENAETKSAIFSASLLHKKWETLRQCVVDVSKNLHTLKVNRVLNKDTGEEEVTRMTVDQIIDLTICDTGMARAVGLDHVRNEIIVNGGEIDQFFDELSGLSAILNGRYFIRNMTMYFALPYFFEYVDSDKVDHFWFKKEEETFKSIQGHLAEWRRGILRHADLSIELQHYNKMMADRQAEHAVIVERRLKMEREMDRLRFAERAKLLDQSILKTIQDRMKAEKEAAKALIARNCIRSTYDGSLMWRVEEEDFELRRQEKELDGDEWKMGK